MDNEHVAFNSDSLEKAASLISRKELPEGFIKITDAPVNELTSEQKVILNRKGNEVFNGGKIPEASRIFITTGYSDGLTRVGDYYMEKNKELTALRFFILAKNKKKCASIYEKIAKIISAVIDQG